MKTEIVTITPEMAKEMLSKNNANRKIRTSTVDFYAKQMKEGSWHLTGQGITFGQNGQLLDGQHRLNAIVKADIPVEMLVVRDAEVVSTYDCGIRRSTADQFYLANMGFANCIMQTTGISICRLCKSLYDTGGLASDGRYISTDALAEWIKENEDDMTWITAICNSNSSSVKGVRRSIIYATLWAIYRLGYLSKADVERICRIIRDGVMRDDNDAPVVGFRTKLISSSRMTNTEVYYRLMYAVKKHISGSALATNRYDTKTGFDFKELKDKKERN